MNGLDHYIDEPPKLLRGIFHLRSELRNRYQIFCGGPGLELFLRDVPRLIWVAEVEEIAPSADEPSH